MWQTLGFEKQKVFFEKAIQNGLSHAYLFVGQEMIGKKTFALELASKINKANGVDPDLMILDASQSESGQTIGIEEVRGVKQFLSLSPFSGIYKCAVISDVHLMTIEAQNAILKVLEEPPSHGLIFLVTHSPDTLLPTVISRCQVFSFFPDSSKITELLSEVKASDKEKDILLHLANGRIGLIKKLIDKKSLGDIGKSIEELGQLLKMDINDRLGKAQILAEADKNDLKEKILYWLLYVRTRINDPKAANIAKHLLKLHETIQHPQYNTRLALENFLVQI